MKSIRYVLDRERRRLVAIPAGGNGEGGGEGDPPAPGTPADPPPGGGGSDKVFTQEEVNRMMAREKSQGRDAAIRDVADQLGVSVEEAKDIIQNHQQQMEAQKTEAQKAQEAADRAKAEAEAEKQLAARERHDLKVERAVGIADPQKAAKVARMLDLEVGASDEEISAAVEATRELFPMLFEQGQGGGGRKLPDSDPGPSPKPKPSGEDGYSRGADRAKEYQDSMGGVKYT